MGFFGDIFGGISSIFNMHQQEKAMDMQDNFARHGIRIKVQDAKDAGINPYAALGASTTMPAAIAGGADFSGFGQGLDRALDAGRTTTERTSAFEEKSQKLQLDNMDLQNKILAADLAKKTAGTPPAVPSLTQRWQVDGQGNVALPDIVKIKPTEINPGEPGSPFLQPGANPEVGFTRTKTGYAPVPSDAAMKAQSNDMLGMLMWNLRNRLLPGGLGGDFAPPPDRLLKPGHVWQWNPATWEYYQVRLSN